MATGASTSSISCNVSSTTNAMVLYACTRCNSRYPFEDLSPGEMLCKDCRDAFVVVKCTYCRNEFQQDSKSNLTSICRKCDQSVKQYGKPTLCEYCNIIAAFIGNKCQRCTYSEKKYGPPVPCDQCKQRCAFDRKDPESRKRVDGKLLCWLCTLSYKRALAKAKHKESSMRSSSLKRESSRGSSSHKSSRFKCDNGASSGGVNHSNGNSHNSTNSSSSAAKKGGGGGGNIDYVKSFIKTSNGTFLPAPNNIAICTSVANSVVSTAPVTSTSINLDTANDIISVTDNVVAVTQLREKILSLDRQLKAKNQELLKKDVKITELKSEISKEQRDCREKIQELQRKHNERIQELQQKVTSLSKQLVSMQKASKKSNNNAAVSAISNNGTAEDSPLSF